jgi:predicted aspartyl protease
MPPPANDNQPMTSLRSLFGTAVCLLLINTTAHAAGDAGACRYVPVAKVPVALSPDRQPTIEGSINGTPMRMLLDTGAYTSHLMPGTAERLGIALDQSGQYAMGVGGAAVIYVARLKDFGIGPRHFGKAVMPVIGATGGDLGVPALVGADFLLQMDLEIALADKFIQFLRASDCNGTFLAYWDQNAMEVPFSGMEEGSLKPYVEVMLNGVKLQAILDTGATRTTVSRHAAALAGITPESANVVKGSRAYGVGGASVGTWMATFDSFAIGDETIRNAELSIRDESQTGRGRVDVVLGVDFLRAHRILFAMSQQKLYLSYLGGDVFGAPHGTAR